ncbi:MAG: response regulator [Oscillospiraceae bacterium]|nr:response regulator [Oscillospiraceae bacterium]
MPAARKKIIYVDDIMMHLVSFKYRLEKLYEIYPAQNSETLFKILNSTMPDLILLDVNMPDVNGFEILEKLKRNLLYSGIPVIFLTSQNDRETFIKAMELGAVDIINKPFSDTALTESIENQLDPIKRDENKPVILAVDDNPSILKSINHSLSGKYRVYTLPKPEMLKSLLMRLTPDLFLLDCQMPVMNGFDLIPVIRGFAVHEETPIVFLTSEGTVDSFNAAINLGANGFIVKPIDEAVLNEKMAALLSDFIMHRRIRAL